MPDDFTQTLLALLNGTDIVENEADWRSVERAPRGPVLPAGLEFKKPEAHEAEDRFALTICSGMAKLKSFL